MNASMSRGRRPGDSDSRERILEVARSRFLADGYQAVSMRSIAKDAGVDVALVSYFFGSKQKLFAAAMQLPVNPVEVITAVLAEPGDDLPERMLANLLATWDNPEIGGRLVALARAAAHDEQLRAVIAEGVGSEIVTRLAKRIGGREAKARAGAFVTQMSGVIFSRYVMGIEPIASMKPADVVRRMAPGLRAAIASQ